MSAPGVCHLRSSSGLYGAEQMLLGLCAEQQRRGQGPVLLAFAPTGGDPPALLAAALAAGIDARALPCRGALDPGCLRALRAQLVALQSQGIGVLHCHDYKSVVYGRLASRGLGLWRVATAHGWLPGGLRLRAYRALELRMLRGFDRVCAVSDAIADSLQRAGLRTPRISRIDNGIDLQRFRLAQHRRSGPALMLGSAARLSAEKNLAQLIRCLADARRRGGRFQLTLCGEGPLRGELERLVAELGMGDCVALPGPSAHLEDWYPTLDAFVLVSLSEGMPLTVLEALACGCPVLASDAGAMPALLAGLPGCRIVPRGDGEALAQALGAIAARSAPDPRLRQRVAERYSLTHMAEAYAAAYRPALPA